MWYLLCNSYIVFRAFFPKTTAIIGTVKFMCSGFLAAIAGNGIYIPAAALNALFTEQMRYPEGKGRPT